MDSAWDRELDSLRNKYGCMQPGPGALSGLRLLSLILNDSTKIFILHSGRPWNLMSRVGNEFKSSFVKTLRKNIFNMAAFS